MVCSRERQLVLTRTPLDNQPQSTPCRPRLAQSDALDWTAHVLESIKRRHLVEEPRPRQGASGGEQQQQTRHTDKGRDAGGRRRGAHYVGCTDGGYPPDCAACSASFWRSTLF